MSVYKKLQEVAVELQNSPIKKSGKNKFAGFSYFELGDFLPTVNELMKQHGLNQYCSFTKELASLTITDVDDETQVVVTSPMVEISMKGANEIQNLGAVETYQRRYLYLAALGIVENDVADRTSHDKTKEKEPTIDPKQYKKAMQLFSEFGNQEQDLILKKYGVDRITLTTPQATLTKMINAMQKSIDKRKNDLPYPEAATTPKKEDMDLLKMVDKSKINDSDIPF